MFNFNNSYLTLPTHFYSLVKPSSLNKASIVFLNTALANNLDIDTSDKVKLEKILFGNHEPTNSNSFAQAYAGHQFGNFTMLGDGRAIVLGEHLTNSKNRFDIQLKGGGRTPYSRGGDGKATLKAMLREYVISEAMHFLKIKTSRSLAVIQTGESVYRQTEQEGAMVVRVMESHIRIGTFEFASYMVDDKISLKTLLNYTVNKLYPHLKNSPNLAVSFIEHVMNVQIQLIANWMRVGFIHGVINTDNVAISGETFDYGPCSFINNYHPNTVFSSIDSNARYAFANQPNMTKWNVIKLAQALLPLVHEDQQTAIGIVKDTLEQFDKKWFDIYYNTMLNKIGIEHKTTEDRFLVDELLQIMKTNQLDYTNTFLSLSYDIELLNELKDSSILKSWQQKWTIRISKKTNGFETAKSIMQQNNPVFIPRNNIVETALDEACAGNYTKFNVLLEVVQNPYYYNPIWESFLKPPTADFENAYQTFCGT